MSADFNWWLLLVGMVIGGALAWLVLADSNRRDRDIEDVETAAEAAWIARALGRTIAPEMAEHVLRAHRRYLGFPPPDALVDPAQLRPAAESEAAVAPAEDDAPDVTVANEPPAEVPAEIPAPVPAPEEPAAGAGPA